MTHEGSSENPHRISSRTTCKGTKKNLRRSLKTHGTLENLWKTSVGLMEDLEVTWKTSIEHIKNLGVTWKILV